MPESEDPKETCFSMHLMVSSGTLSMHTTLNSQETIGMGTRLLSFQPVSLHIATCISSGTPYRPTGLSAGCYC